MICTARSFVFGVSGMAADSIPLSRRTAQSSKPGGCIGRSAMMMSGLTVLPKSSGMDGDPCVRTIFTRLDPDLSGSVQSEL
jgi:hypothetical protein